MGIEDDIMDVDSRLSDLEDLVSWLLTDEQVARLDNPRLIAAVIRARTGHRVEVWLTPGGDYGVCDRRTGDLPHESVLALLTLWQSRGMRIGTRKE